MIKSVTKECLKERLFSRWYCKNKLRQYVHKIKIEKLLFYIQENQSFLDVGRGGSVDGILGVYAAKKGAKVTISNIDELHLNAIKELAEKEGVLDKIYFDINAPTNLKYPINSFDIVASIHVLEHITDFEKALSEIKRVTKENALIALPTCLNLSALSRLGGAPFFEFRFLSIPCLFYGIIRFIEAIIMKKKGISEQMIEKGIVIDHMWRFPWVMISELVKSGFIVCQFDADSIVLPWFHCFLPINRFLDKHSNKCILKYCGLGSHAYLKKINE